MYTPDWNPCLHSGPIKSYPPHSIKANHVLPLLETLPNSHTLHHCPQKPPLTWPQPLTWPCLPLRPHVCPSLCILLITPCSLVFNTPPWIQAQGFAFAAASAWNDHYHTGRSYLPSYSSGFDSHFTFFGQACSDHPR